MNWFQWIDAAEEHARKLYAYDEFVLNEGKDAAEQAFDNGETPQEFVEWFGEKYDLIKFD